MQENKLQLAESSVVGWYVDKHNKKYYMDSLYDDYVECSICRRNIAENVMIKENMLSPIASYNFMEYFCPDCVEFVRTFGSKRK